MFFALIAAGAAATAPVSTPALKTIAKVTASTACLSLAHNVNAAILAAQENDAAIADASATLANPLLQNGNIMQRHASESRLSDDAASIVTKTPAEESVLTRLRAIAPPAENGADLTNFGDFILAMQRTLTQQATIGSELASVSALLAKRDASGLYDAHTRADSESEAGAVTPFGIGSANAYAPVVNPKAQGLQEAYRADSIPATTVTQGKAGDSKPVYATNAQYAAAEIHALTPYTTAVRADESSAMASLHGSIPGCGI